MKILMATPYFYPHTGGTEKYVKDLALGLMAKGHEVTVLSNDTPRSVREEVVDGIKVKRLPCIDMFYLPMSWAFRTKMLKGFDIIHSHAPAFGFVRSIGKKLPIPHVCTCHCDITVSGGFAGIPIPRFFTFLLEFFGDAVGRSALRKCDTVISTTESYASTSPVLKKIPHKVVPIGIHYGKLDAARKKLGLTPDTPKKKQILFLGRLASNKGVNYLISALPKILGKHPDLKLMIAGEGEEKPSLLRLANKLKVSNSIEWHGKLTLEKLTEMYSTSAAFILPSVNRLEAFGIVQLEAMACYTPVIASNIPGVNNVMDVGKNGLLVEPRDPAGIADAVLKILSDPQKIKEMGKHGRDLVEKKYNWDIIVAQIEGIYKSLLEKKK